MRFQIWSFQVSDHNVHRFDVVVTVPLAHNRENPTRFPRNEPKSLVLRTNAVWSLAKRDPPK